MDYAKQMEGTWTVETLSTHLGIGRQSAINLLSRLRKQGHVVTDGGGHVKRIYRISAKKQVPFNDGMFDILNRYSPQKIIPPFEHKTYGPYSVEDAIIDLLEFPNIRMLSGILFMFNAVTDWTKLREKIIARGYASQLGVLYNIARIIRKTHRMPKTVENSLFKKRNKSLEPWLHSHLPKEKRLWDISERWNLIVPFSMRDLEGLHD